MNVLVLFSGTHSVEKVFEKKGCKCYSVDLDNTFKPTFNVDILKWDYKTDLKNVHIDYIHSSPICKNYTNLKNHNRNKNDVDFSNSLVKKTIEIIEYFKSKNPQLRFTIENPKGYLRTTKLLDDYKMITTSYCKYSYPYQKDTDFWYGGFDLKLKSQCSKKCPCSDRKDLSYHKVRIGFKGKWKDGKKVGDYPLQIQDGEYFKQLKEKHKRYKDYSHTYLRYRIPKRLIQDIWKSHFNTPFIDENNNDLWL